MKLERGGIAKVAIVAIVVVVIVVVAVVAVVLMKPPEEPTQTPTDETTPTEESTPTEEVTPMPGATLIGPIEISEKASSGTINFTISEDGASITYVSVTLNDVDVGIFTAGSISTSTSTSITITGGAFSASVSGMGEIDGQFTSSTEASGTIDLVLDIYQIGDVEFGKWNWSATVD